MKDILILTQLMDFAGGPEAGEWYEKGHLETKFLEDRGVGMYHVLLTREEWDEIERKLDEHYEYERFELEGG